jgi:hypothetical protein
MLEKTNANLPTHMRPAGENKGTCKSVSLLDACTFKVTLWSDKIFEGKVRATVRIVLVSRLCLSYCAWGGTCDLL